MRSSAQRLPCVHLLPSAVPRATDEDKLNLLNRAKCFIFDCDGVYTNGCNGAVLSYPCKHRN